MPFRDGDFVWPLGNAILGLPMRGGFYRHDDFEENNALNTTQNPGWVTVGSAGAVFTGTAPTATAGTFVRGFVRWTLTADPVAPKAAWRRYQAWSGVGADQYSTTFFTAFWVRWRMNTNKPAVDSDYYVSPGGIAAQSAGVIEPVNGMGVVFDTTLGVDQWVLRCWRAGVPIQLPLGIAWNDGPDDFRSALVVHRGNRIFAFRGDPRRAIPMVPVGSLVGPEIQPAADCTPYNAHLEQRSAAIPFNPSIDMDYWGWGGSVL